MANPQLENGYVRIASELIEALARAKFNGTQRRIIDVVIRNTYGYGKKTASLSDGFISRATGIHPKQINREINTLITNNVLYLESKGDFTNARIIGLNKNYEAWAGNYLVTTNKNIGTNENIEKGGNEKVEKVVTKPLHNKENVKKNIKIYPMGSLEMSLTLELVMLMRKNNPKVKIPDDLNKWATEVNKMIRLDGRTPEDIRRVIYYSQTDKFWQCNILSTKKLREKFDTLYLKCKNSSFIPLNDDEMDSFRIVLSEIREGESDG